MMQLPSWLNRGHDGANTRRRTTRMLCDRASCNLGEIVDISATGARVVCRRFFRPIEGKPTTLTIDPPVGGPLEIPCVVCWARKHGRYWEAGLAFHTLTPGQARVLGDFVMQSHRARSA